MNSWGKRVRNFSCSGGFAIPTVLIASIVMLTVLIISVTSTTAVRVSLVSQHYDQLAQTSGEAGIAYAKACLEANNGVSQWTDEKPLRPNTDCTGTQLPGFSCPSDDARCYLNVSNESKLRTTFKVGLNQDLPPSGWKQVSSGNSHVCAISSNDQAYCWGYNGYGQIGDQSNTNRLVPAAVNNDGALNGKTITSISSGSNHTCAIASDKNVYCWGTNAEGQLGNNTKTQSLVPVPVDTSGALNGLTVNSLSVGWDHACVVASDDNAYCWGTNYNGQLGNNTTVSSSTPVPVDKTVVSALFGKTVKSISAGMRHTCVIASDDQAYCWGYNYNGQLGDSSTAQRNYPVKVNTLGVLNDKTVNSIVVGNFHSCAIASDEKAYCWGYNYNGQLGDGSFNESHVPVAVDTTGVLNNKPLISITTGDYHSCAVSYDYQAYCWGYGYYGGLGNSFNNNSSVPVTVTNNDALSGKTVKSISAGHYSACVVASDNKVYCWGYNYYGQLGNNSNSNTNAPAAVNTTGLLVEDIASFGYVNLVRSDSSVWRQYHQTVRLNLVEVTTKDWFSSHTIATGSYHSCSITLDNLAYCWGYNDEGQLGDGKITDRSYPVAVDTSDTLNGMTIKSIGTGDRYTCAIASDDNPYCWGENGNGQLGDNSTYQSNYPVAVDKTNGLSALYGKTVKYISVGSWHACAVAFDDNAYCWGNNSDGQLGDNSIVQKNYPVAVNKTNGLSALYGKTVKSILSGGDPVSSGGYHSCVIANDDKAYCWGYNGNGQLGDNSAVTQRINPVAVYATAGALSGKTIKSISAGFRHTCVIANDNNAYCWGNNGDGQLGDTSIIQKNYPVAVDNSGALSGKTIKSISAGFRHTCVIASDDKAYCWGYNGNGQLGDNSVTQSSVPVPVYESGVLSGKTITSISADKSHTCAISSDNRLYCWGSNANGYLGDNSTNQSSIPVPVVTVNNQYLPTRF